MSKAQRLIRLANRIPVKTLADVRATVGKEDYYDIIFTLGKDTVNDGFAAEYYWDSDSQQDDNNEDVIRPTSTGAAEPGRWIRVVRIFNVTDEVLFFADFKGNGSTKLFQFVHNFNSVRVIAQLIRHPAQVDGPYTDVDTVIDRYANYIEVHFNTAPRENEEFTVMIVNLNVTLTN
jgi:hypothetical protein